MALDDISTAIQKKLSQAAHIKARVQFDFGNEGVVFVDNTVSPPVVTSEAAEADLTLRCSPETFRAILAGTQNPNIAYMMGKLKVKGPMSLAMKLNSVLED